MHRTYKPTEYWADAAVHIFGMPLGLLAAINIVARSTPYGPAMVIVNTIYGAGLVGMLTASGIYQMAPAGNIKERLRRIDKAMIFVMIAGTYTPISTITLFGHHGVELAAIIWAMAGLGIFVSLRYPRRFEKALFGLYFAMSYMLLVLINETFHALHHGVLALLITGGLTYTVGAAIRARRKLFHNPVWHGLVLLAAAQQYAAIALQLTGGV
jgi:hemolysin III